MLRAVLPTDADLEAVCGDSLPEAAARFANNMDRVAKVNLLLDVVDGQKIRTAVPTYDPESLAAYERRPASTRYRPAQPLSWPGGFPDGGGVPVFRALASADRQSVAAVRGAVQET